MSSLTMIVVMTLAVIFTADAAYINNWDQPFNFKCPKNQVITSISSVHDNGKEDRRWEFLCKKYSSGTNSCIDSGYVNSFDDPLVFTCPGDTVIAGSHSYNSNHYNDRRFGFHCCKVDWRRPRDCYTTDYVNNWDDKMAFVVPKGRVIKGAFSHHDNSREDRRWKFLICSI